MRKHLRTILVLTVAALALSFFAWSQERQVQHAAGATIVTGQIAPRSVPQVGRKTRSGVTSVTPNEMHSWAIHKDGDGKAYSAGGIVVTLRKAKDKDDNWAPEISAESADGRVGRAIGQAWSDDNILADFGIGKIDPDNDTSEVVFSTYSGGAHCCTDTKILELTKSGWTVLDLGPRDGDTPLFPQIVNGTRAFVLYDDNFLYAFASHADSYSPPQVFVIRDAKIVDESASGKYRAVYEKDLKETEAACRKHQSQNGACAAFVADAARLGRERFEDAWEIMLQNYDKHDSWKLPADCDVPLGKAFECPKGHEHKFDNYPDALRAFLRRGGYIPVLR